MDPDDLLYTKEHEWIRIEGDFGTVGITAHAQEALGDVVYVELPKVGSALAAHHPFGTVESVKAVSELFTPMSGEVLEVNTALSETPDTLNTDPYGKGWLMRIRIGNLSETAALMSSKAYDEYLATQE